MSYKRFVMAGLDPATQWPRVDAAERLFLKVKSAATASHLPRARTCAHWVAGSSPAMTNIGAGEHS